MFSPEGRVEDTPPLVNESYELGPERHIASIRELIEAEACRQLEKDSKYHEKASLVRFVWLKLSNAFTFFIPEFILAYFGMQSHEMRTAWREKVTLCGFIALVSGLMLFFIMGFTAIICPEQHIMSLAEVQHFPRYRPHLIVHGIVYDATLLVAAHTANGASPTHIENWAGKDASSLFPRPSDLAAYARKYAVDLFGASSSMDSSDMPRKRNNFPDKNRDDLYIHSISNYATLLSLPYHCHYGISLQQLQEGFTSNNAKVAVFDKVYDVSRLLDQWDDRLSEKALNGLAAPWGRDKSSYFAYTGAKQDLHILEDYLIGVLDRRSSFNCLISKYILIGSTAILASIMLVKFLAALQLGSKKSPESLNKFVIMQVKRLLIKHI